MNLVIDCSVAFKWAVVEIHRPKAILLRDDFRNGIHELFAPDHFPAEIGNAFLIAERRRAIGPGDGALALIDVLQTLPVIAASIPLLPRAYEIAHRHQRTVYVSLYVALAEREQCDFITADNKLVNGLQAAFPFVVHLASMP
ncbi:MAG: type II toxin-antitoxin system VapC family toxin [Planctomycetes bacterium]|nr:type II toxin-antitoxin system VapC family toxin [Planctomycetota bacterium]